jgi:hypothetical protein
MLDGRRLRNGSCVCYGKVPLDGRYHLFIDNTPYLWLLTLSLIFSPISWLSCDKAIAYVCSVIHALGSDQYPGISAVHLDTSQSKRDPARDGYFCSMSALSLCILYSDLLLPRSTSYIMGGSSISDFYPLLATPHRVSLFPVSE